MDPFIWGFVRGGSATLAIGCWPVAFFAVYKGQAVVGFVFAVCAIVAACLFALNEARRPR